MTDSESGQSPQVTPDAGHTQVSKVPTPGSLPGSHSGWPFCIPQQAPNPQTPCRRPRGHCRPFDAHWSCKLWIVPRPGAQPALCCPGTCVPSVLLGFGPASQPSISVVRASLEVLAAELTSGLAWAGPQGQSFNGGTFGTCAIRWPMSPWLFTFTSKLELLGGQEFVTLDKPGYPRW